MGIYLYFAVALSLTVGFIFAFVGNFWFNFKIPSVFVNIIELGQEKLPRADNGKILRKKLYDLVNGLI